MKHPLLAVTASIAAVLVGAGGFAGPWTMTGAVVVLVVAAALGWPQMLGAPARKSLTAVIGVTGLIAVGAVSLGPSLGPGQDQGEDPAELGASLIEPIAVCIALGVLAAFMVQLLRGSGSPHRLESTAGTITGVAVVCAGSGWVALARFEAGPLAVSVGVSLALAALAGLVPFPGPSGRGLAAGLSVAVAGVVPLVLSAVWPAAWPAFPLPAALVSGALGGLVLVLAGRTAPDHGVGRPVGQRAAIALGVAPVAAMGLLTYFVFRIMPA